MKKTIALCLIFCALLCGCQKQVNGGGSSESDTSVKEEQTVDHTGDTSEGNHSDTEQTRLAYYEQLVNELQQEVLSLKTEIYSNRVEYESRIDELEAGKSASTGGSVSDPTTNVGATDTESLPFRYTVENGAVTITSYIGKEKTVEIPATVNGCPVVAIGDRAFLDNASLTSVTIPSGVKSIGWFAFSGCVSLTYVSIPDSVAVISYGAFQNCNAKMTVACSANSYADQYAKSYGITVQN